MLKEISCNTFMRKSMEEIQNFLNLRHNLQWQKKKLFKEWYTNMTIIIIPSQ